MIIIFSPIISERLRYICNFIFSEHFVVDYRITDDVNQLNATGALIINYSNVTLPFSSVKINPHSLLFENEILNHSIEVFEYKNHPAIFKTIESDYGFDIFAATFFLITRYEEYLPHEKDAFGRFCHQQSIAHKNNFLQKPLVNFWLLDFISYLTKTSPIFIETKKEFSQIVTYDIDMAWAYANKGWKRNIGGFLKRPSLERINVLLGRKKDPFDIFDELNLLHKEKELDPIYFFLVAETRSEFDKNISISNKNMSDLLIRLAEKYTIGIHPSWRSNFNPSLLHQEKKEIEAIIHQSIKKSRQHFLKFNLPDTYRQLIQMGIEEDYSMGYGTINGFRASYAGSYLWFDLKNNTTSPLRLFPFCFMDATTLFEEKKSPAEAFEELKYYFDICKKSNGLFISIFHNHIISNKENQKQWKKMHNNFIQNYQ